MAKEKIPLTLPQAATRAPQGKRKNSFLTSLVRYHELYILFIPVAVWLIIFRYVPMGGLILAFKRYNPFVGILESPWIGFANFTRAFNSPSFVNSFFNTIILSLSMLVICFPVPILLAILLNEIRRIKFKRFVQTVSYLPHFISWSVAGGMIYTLLSPNTGIVNLILKNFGHSGINFLGEAANFRMVIIFSDMWKNAGWGSIIFLAAIAGVDEEMYEAAIIDGANRIKMIFYITIPSIMNTIIVMFILRVGRLFEVSFEQIFILVNPTVLSVGETISYYIYRVGFVDPTNFGFGTAIGLFESVIGLILVYTTNKISKKLRGGEGGIW